MKVQVDEARAGIGPAPRKPGVGRSLGAEPGPEHNHHQSRFACVIALAPQPMADMISQ